MQAGRGKRVEMGGMLLCAFKALTGAFFWSLAFQYGLGVAKFKNLCPFYRCDGSPRRVTGTIYTSTISIIIGRYTFPCNSLALKSQFSYP